MQIRLGEPSDFDAAVKVWQAPNKAAPDIAVEDRTDLLHAPVR